MSFLPLSRLFGVCCALVILLAQASSSMIDDVGVGRKSADGSPPWTPGQGETGQQILGKEHEGVEWARIRPESSEDPLTMPTDPLEELHYALETLQKHYFELSVGTWPDSIDWTGAVMGTYVSASLGSLTKALDYIITSGQAGEGHRVENEINKFFSQSISYYFGENAFAIRMQAYDDMLWVVLGWLESIRFIYLHIHHHYGALDSPEEEEEGAWYGKQFIQTFAHRARVFFDLATNGWDTALCGGGMVWNPHLEPYKNAITNQLFVSASVSMYLYFPGDRNPSPFMSAPEEEFVDVPPARPHDPKYLFAAMNTYSWLKESNMTNAQGLYVDGYHIHDYGKNGTIGTGDCDERNEMVYTYNQGVLLSGLRGLWEGTGLLSYLDDGHALVRSVIRATGWETPEATPSSQWSGLGRNGILEDYCDARGDCNQDGQTFKGIFFHHLTLFCEPLPTKPLVPGRTFAATPAERRLHARSCKEYAPWVLRNARAALKTRDGNGDFGMWWGESEAHRGQIEPVALPEGAVDWRNNDTLARNGWLASEGGQAASQRNGRSPRRWRKTKAHLNGDANDRGRGRTVETQGGGVSVVRAMWEFVNSLREEEEEG